MQAIFSDYLYNASMATKETLSNLRKLRIKAGISLRELARQINEQPSNVSYWERTGKLPKSEVLIPMAEALGVTVEQLLNEAAQKKKKKQGGKLGLVLEELATLPRRQQQEVVNAMESMVAGQKAKAQ